MTLSGKIVFSSGASTDFDIWSLDFDTRTLSQLTSGEQLNDFPKWSPSGEKVAFVSTGEDSIPSLWIMNADGSDQHRLTDNIVVQAPSWSPDGREIVFAGNGVDKTQIDVCIFSFSDSYLSSGTVSTLLSHTGVEETPSFSPDGKRVIFSAPAVANDGQYTTFNTDIFEYDISTKNIRALATHPSLDYAPSYSPDGSRITFVSHRDRVKAEEAQHSLNAYRDAIVNGSNAEARAAINKMRGLQSDGEVFVMNLDGSELRQLTYDSQADNSISWSPDGKYLIYTSSSTQQNETERLKILDVESGKKISFHYDRAALESELGVDGLINRTFLQRIIPNSIERRLLADQSIWGEERRPHWIR